MPRERRQPIRLDRSALRELIREEARQLTRRRSVVENADPIDPEGELAFALASAAAEAFRRRNGYDEEAIDGRMTKAEWDAAVLEAADDLEEQLADVIRPIAERVQDKLFDGQYGSVSGRDE